MKKKDLEELRKEAEYQGGGGCMVDGDTLGCLIDFYYEAREVANDILNNHGEGCTQCEDHGGCAMILKARNLLLI